MRTPAVRRAAPVVLVLLAAACGDAPDRIPTAPVAPPSLEVVGPAACVNRPTGQQISQDIGALLSGTARRDAQQQFGDVQRVCTTDLTLARTRTFVVLNTILGTLTPSVRATWLASEDRSIVLARLLNNLFLYVGYPTPGIQPVTVTRAGALQLLTDPTAAFSDVITGDGAAILRVPVGAATGSRLYSITPIGANCLTTNLEQIGGCFDISAAPEVQTFAEALVVGICQTRDLTQTPELDKRRIGHESSIGNKTTDVLPRAVLPQIAGFCAEPASGAIGPLPAGAGVFERLWHGARQLAGGASRALSVKTAYALHGGLGGSTTALSPFGTVNRDVFLSTFEVNAAGPIIKSSLPNGTLPERGTWDEARADPPGSIVVAVDPSAEGNKLAVLNQGGGACGNQCGGLSLRGKIDPSRLSTETANEGVYQVDFTLAQMKPVVKSAPFAVLDSDGRVIAKLEFRTLSSNRELLFNGQVVGTWEVGRKQTFTIVVDFANVSPAIAGRTRRTRLEIDDESVLGGKWWTFGSDVTDLRFFDATFDRIDAGIFQLDQVRIKRVDADPAEIGGVS